MIEECLVVEFDVTGDDCPLAGATAAADAAVNARPPQRRADGNDLLRFSADAPADDLARALDDDDRIRYLHVSRSDGRANFRCLSTHPCAVHRLTDAGFLADRLRYDGGSETYAGAVVGHDVLEGVLEAAGEAVGVSLRRIYPLVEDDDDAVGRRWDLTPAQAEALQTAWRMGYFEVPKEATAAEVAAELGVGKTAFLERLRRGQSALFEQLFG